MRVPSLYLGVRIQVFLHGQETIPVGTNFQNKKYPTITRACTRNQLLNYILLYYLERVLVFLFAS